MAFVTFVTKITTKIALIKILGVSQKISNTSLVYLIMFGKCISIALRESKLSVLMYSLFHDHILALYLVFLLFGLVYDDTVNKYCKKRGIIGTLIRVIRFDVISIVSVFSRATSRCGPQFCCSNRS